MKKFTKGTLISIVEDDDRRIPNYLANGWQEEPFAAPTSKDAADETLAKAIKDANASEAAKEDKKGKNGKKGKGATATDKKVNDAIKATTAAAAESEAVDDGLFIREGK